MHSQGVLKLAVSPNRVKYQSLSQTQNGIELIWKLNIFGHEQLF